MRDDEVSRTAFPQPLVEPIFTPTLAEALLLVKQVQGEDKYLSIALKVITAEFDRMRQALLYYANAENYDVDGVVMAPGADAGPDAGTIALIALRKLDYHWPPVVGVANLAEVEGLF